MTTKPAQEARCRSRHATTDTPSGTRRGWTTRPTSCGSPGAAALPFADHTFPTVFTRVLTPGGLLVFFGVHPCFNGPHIEWMDDGGVRAYPTYRLATRQEPAPWWGVHVRRRVGMRHHPLADLFNAFISTGLWIEHVVELGSRPVPSSIGIRARKREATTRG